MWSLSGEAGLRVALVVPLGGAVGTVVDSQVRSRTLGRGPLRCTIEARRRARRTSCRNALDLPPRGTRQHVQNAHQHLHCRAASVGQQQRRCPATGGRPVPSLSGPMRAQTGARRASGRAIFGGGSQAPRVPVPSGQSARGPGSWSTLPLAPRPQSARYPSSMSGIVASSVATPEAPAAGASAESLLPAQLVWPSRSHGCGAVTASEVGQRVAICGWVDRNRDMGGVQFFDVRDHTGLLQASTRCHGPQASSLDSLLVNGP
jgi:hypothetical protein